MVVKSAQVWAGLFVTTDATGAITAATGTPVGALYVNGVANAAVVTITGSNPYKYSVTLPTLTAGQVVSMYITATVSTVAQAFVAAQAIAATYDADTWAYATRTLTQTASSIAAIVAGTALTIQRGDTTMISLTDLGNISARTKLWFSVKDTTVDADASSILFIEETAGLTVLNAATYTTIAHGAIVVSDATTGALTITINAAVTAQLIPDVPYRWDVQMLTASGVTTLTQGDAKVTADVTRATA